MKHKQYKTASGNVLTERDWQRFFGDEGVWRNTEHPQDRGESPTVSTFVTHHTEELVRAGHHDNGYVVRHVRGFHGKGFLPTCYSDLHGHCGNGDIYYGTTAEAYNKAVADGERLVESADKRVDEIHAQIDRQEEREPEVKRLLAERTKLQKQLKNKVAGGKVRVQKQLDEINGSLEKHVEYIHGTA